VSLKYLKSLEARRLLNFKSFQVTIAN
jgi:hypothetical protein